MPLYRPPTNRFFETAPMPGSVAESCHRYTASNTMTPTSGTLYLMSTGLTIGQTVGHIGFCNGSTATTAASHWWVALLDNTYTLQAHCADQLTTNVAASTWYNLAMVAPYTATYTGQYYFGLMVATSSGSQPSIVAPTFSAAAQFVTGANVPTPLLGGTSTTGLTAPGTDGVTTYLAPTATAGCAYMYAAA